MTTGQCLGQSMVSRWTASRDDHVASCCDHTRRGRSTQGRRCCPSVRPSFISVSFSFSLSLSHTHTVTHTHTHTVTHTHTHTHTHTVTHTHTHTHTLTHTHTHTHTLSYRPPSLISTIARSLNTSSHLLSTSSFPSCKFLSQCLCPLTLVFSVVLL